MRTGFGAKLKNRRVYVGQCVECGKVILRWKRIGEDGKPQITDIGLSEEAAIATFDLLRRTLNETQLVRIGRERGDDFQTGETLPNVEKESGSVGDVALPEEKGGEQ